MLLRGDRWFALQDCYTALVSAARWGHADAIRQLLKAGANIEATGGVSFKDRVIVPQRCEVTGTVSAGREDSSDTGGMLWTCGRGS